MKCSICSDSGAPRFTAMYVSNRWLDDPQQFYAGKAAMGDGELIDHRDAEPCLDQRADRGAEPRPDGDVVVQFIAREHLGHDAPVGIVGIDADQRIADDFRRGDLLAACQLDVPAARCRTIRPTPAA